MARFEMIRALLIASCLLFPASRAVSQTVNVFGNATLQAISTDAPTSWIAGGFGRLEGGSNEAGQSDEAVSANIDLGLEWLPTPDIAFYVHGVARGESQAVDEWSAGVVEAWAEMLFRRDSVHEYRLRAGTMILPTSRENTGDFWNSPYMISFSAINSWIAEEIRPTGVDAQYRWDDGTSSIRIAATAFLANDTAGTLLGWRGWSIGNRLSTFREQVPLPPLHSLPVFFNQQVDGTTPFGKELDGRVGWAARARFDRWNRFTIQATHYDNRGDRGLHGDEYSWQTSFDLFALQLRPSDSVTVISEYIVGSTRMGPLTGARVEADLESFYVLASWTRRWLRISGRYDRFRTIERDFSPAENNDEDGDSVAIAIAVQPTPRLRLAVEALDVDVERLAALESGAQRQNGGDAVLVQVRFSF